MRLIAPSFLALLLVACATAPQAPEHATHGHAPMPAATEEKPAPLFEGLGKRHFDATIATPLAQRYFDQGMSLYYGFNHAEAQRSFEYAAKLDPKCAMCWWAAALSLGPNINAAMGDEAVAPAWEFLQKAVALKPGVTRREQDYIDALSKRYVAQPVPDRKELDRAYKEAMEALSKRYPDDLDAAVLHAESVMVRNPWDYWLKDGSPREFTPPLLANLESVLSRDAGHFGAIHLYIHAVEAARPKLAEPWADRLRQMELVGAGHLMHMPSHIYIRVGRYHDSALANEEASRADESYVAQCHAQGVYPLAYHPHNYHFLWASVSLEGRSADAMKAAISLRDHTDPEMMGQPGFGTLQHYAITPLYAMVRFGRWDEILAQPRPSLPYQEAVWHYARGMALAAKKQFPEAERELSRLRAIAADDALKTVTLWDINGVQAILGVAIEHLAGELAGARGDFAAAIDHLRKGVALESDLRYDEPPPWHMPLRQVLGAVLLSAGRAGEAELVYRSDLEVFPENGWSLYGLMKALEAQGSSDAEVEKRFHEAWKYADVELSSSRIF